MDTTQRCRTCKHWTEMDLSAPDREWKVCKLTTLELLVSGCQFSGHAVGGNGDFAGMSYPSEVFTGPDFGCVHWEAKE